MNLFSDQSATVELSPCSPRAGPDKGEFCVQPRGKRKVGRPIAYCGDPNSPDLTPAERRRIMRRIANRESARRVRARRLDVLDEMTQKVFCPDCTAASG